jgi:D-galactarolactone cycloisomerase
MKRNLEHRRNIEIPEREACGVPHATIRAPHSAVTMRIVEIEAFPVSFPLREGATLGIGQARKRDAVLVRVRTSGGLVGWGESHHGRCPGGVAHVANTTLRDLVLGMDAADVVGVWAKIYRLQLGSHGMGAACAMAMSGIDMALWDIRGKAVGWPLHRLLGGAPRAIPAYAGGIALGFQEPASLVDEARGLATRGYRAFKLRVGDSPARDIARVAAVRGALGEAVDVLVDANTRYTLDDARRVMPALDEHGVGWLEEPFPPHDHARYATAVRYGRVPLAAGENHYTRFEFHRLIEDRSVTVFQPDLSKSGGITEFMRIAALASAWKLPIHPHTSTTALNMAATIHALASIENGGYFESDAAPVNPMRDELGTKPYQVQPDGTVWPLEAPGIGIEVDESFIRAHPLIDGPGFM